jgi:hypothetical protein
MYQSSNDLKEILFDSRDIIDEDAFIFIYYKYYLTYVFKYFYFHEDVLIIGLIHKNNKECIFSIKIENILRIMYLENKISLERSDQNISLSLMPYFHFSFFPGIIQKNRPLKFDKYDLLEHLACLPVINEEKKSYEYLSEAKNNIYVRFYFSLTENYVQVILGEDLQKPFCNVGFRGVTEIICTAEKILIINDDEEPEKNVLYLEPFFALECSL